MSEKGIINKVADTPALAEERETISVMIDLYCRDHHQSTPPCESCRELLEYAIERVRQCPLQEERTTCGRCPIHCYKPSMQKKIKAVMRYAGPRMLKAHPLLAAKHLLKSLAKK
ncbi:MAG: nitrous oxide-stimulated promoter family protein [Pseudomonadota bacterium]|nr:nitrous oxide-stimulated promoter family protein [Pseudomonadota bacterium]